MVEMKTALELLGQILLMMEIKLLSQVVLQVEEQAVVFLTVRPEMKDSLQGSSLARRCCRQKNPSLELKKETSSCGVP